MSSGRRPPRTYEESMDASEKSAGRQPEQAGIDSRLVQQKVDHEFAEFLHTRYMRLRADIDQIVQRTPIELLERTALKLAFVTEQNWLPVAGRETTELIMHAVVRATHE